MDDNYRVYRVEDSDDLNEANFTCPYCNANVVLFCGHLDASCPHVVFVFEEEHHSYDYLDDSFRIRSIEYIRKQGFHIDELPDAFHDRFGHTLDKMRNPMPPLHKLIPHLIIEGLECWWDGDGLGYLIGFEAKDDM